MSRSLAGRALALALSLWLSLFLGESELIVRCPAHGRDASPASSMAHIAGAATTTAEHHHGAGSTASGRSPGTQTAPAEHDAAHTCSCPGPGCFPPAVAVLPGGIIPLAHLVAVHEAVAVATLDRLAGERDHILPFSTAPPATTLAHVAA